MTKAPGTESAALKSIGAARAHRSFGKAATMIDFICPTCGQFSFEDEACASCVGRATEELAA